MRDLSIDIETYCDVDIKKCGLYKYVRDDSFEVLLFAYSVDFKEVQIVDLKSGEEVPKEIIEAMSDANANKHAHNAAFEYNALQAYGFDVGDRFAWKCSMFHAMYLGYPAGLANTGAALNLSEDKSKSNTGKALIRYFSVPCRPTKSNSGRRRNLPEHDPEKWRLFKDYCKQDVVAETEIYKRLAMFPLPSEEQRIWVLSDEMNARGIGVDMDLVDGALEINDKLTEEQEERARIISDVQNPNSTSQILEWIQKFMPDVDNVRKATVSDLLSRDDLHPDVREFLEIRQELSKTSVKKYDAIKSCVCDDGRVRGLLQVYGANRTGRWAGRLVQVQNLPRNYLVNLRLARDLTKDRGGGALEELFGNATDTISQLIRTAFVPQNDKKYVVSDYSAIEARVIAWLAGEEWVNEVFRTHGKIYEATASQMFNVPIEKIKKGNPEYALRQKGKVATLALGYQGGENALIAMGADRMGLSHEELTEIKDKWRAANKNIVNLWYAVDNACIDAIRTGITQYVNNKLVINYEAEGVYGQSFLTIRLPSGRKLFYPNPELKDNQFDRQSVHFEGIGLNKKLKSESTYGGKLTENIVQAIARDCLALLLVRLDKKYHDNPVVMHIHDEVVLECDKSITVDEINAVMSEPIDWAEGLVLKGAGFENDFYMKV